MLRRIINACLPFIAAAAIAVSAQSREKEAALLGEVENLRRELSALETLKNEKLDLLEQRESARWQARYQGAAKSKEADESLRILEDAFSRLASESGRLEEEWIKAKAEAEEKQEALDATREGWQALASQLKRRSDEAASGVSSDFPVGLEERALAYSRAAEALQGKNPDMRAGLDAFFRAGLGRLDLTLTQALESRTALFEDGRAAPAWRLRLGTLFLAEAEKEGAASQILLRTGSLQGRTFAWRQNLAGDYNLRLRETVLDAARGRESALVPMDVLQFKSTGSGFVRGEEKSAWAGFREWFKAGGVTLYPLFGVGILALLIIMERLWFYSRRAVNTEAFMARFRPLMRSGDWQGARELCARSKSSLARALGAVAAHAGSTRMAAERAVREVMLREVPGHEKRLSLLAAMGTAAPLLGLLGTVSGLVTLFKVLNQLGSNDPKVLAGGISEALINAETGLAIAIPVLLIHGWLQERADALNAALSSHSLEAMNTIWPKE